MIIFFFFNDTATTEIYTLSLHDALPISLEILRRRVVRGDDQIIDELRLFAIDQLREQPAIKQGELVGLDRKSTRLNSSHANISYAVFCLKKKKKQAQTRESSVRHASSTR